MADEQQDVNFEDVGAGAEDVGGPRKPGIFSGALLTVLKWAAIAVAFAIVGGTVAFFVTRITMRGNEAQGLASGSPAYQPASPPLAYSDTIPAIRGNTSDPEPSSFTIELSLGYPQSDKQVGVEIGQRMREIQDLAFKYLSGKTAEDLGPRYYDLIQDDLRNRINGVLTTGKIERVTFRSYAVVKL